MHSFLRDEEGAVAIEYVVIGALIAAVLIPILYTLFNGLRDKLQEIHDEL